MHARGAPVIAPFVAPTMTTQPVRLVTRNSSSVKATKQRPKLTPEERPKKTRMPGQKRAKKPPSVTGYYWRKEGAGWDLRKAVYVEENGARKRKQPYVGHLSQETFQEIKRQHKGAALEKAIARWIADRDR